MHEHSTRFMTSLEAKKELMIAVKQAKVDKKSSGLISFDREEDSVKVFSRVYFGRAMWKLNIQ